MTISNINIVKYNGIRFIKCLLRNSLDNKFPVALQYYYKARNLALHKTHPELFDDVTTQASYWK